jgi:mannose/cellobiose epimerase-like protein (N-acyl-D-glucosamine 2-epimerase family)
MQMEFLDAADRLLVWCRDEALPVWSTSGIDAQGRFVEQISARGRPEPHVHRRVRVEFRQVYSFTHAHLLGLGADLLPVANKAMARAISDSFADDDAGQEQGCFFLLDQDGRVVDPKLYLYTQAFYLLALAWRYRADGNKVWLESADRMIAFLERDMASPHGGYVESLCSSLPRRQNPHMHLFEAFLALHKASGASRYLMLADRIFDLFAQHFYDANSGCVIEYFTDEWKRDPQEDKRVEPGHMMEWAWLLDQYQDQSGHGMRQYVERLYLKAIEIGTDPDSGLLLDEVQADGTVLKASRRSWPQTEYLKAAVAMARRGHVPALGHATFVINALLTTYLNTPVRGIWRDAYDNDGATTGAAANASTFYHIVAAISEVAAFARATRETQPYRASRLRGRDLAAAYAELRQDASPSIGKVAK